MSKAHIIYVDYSSVVGRIYFRSQVRGAYVSLSVVIGDDVQNRKSAVNEISPSSHARMGRGRERGRHTASNVMMYHMRSIKQNRQHTSLQLATVVLILCYSVYL